MTFAGRSGWLVLLPLVTNGPGGRTPSPPKRALYPVRTRYNDAGNISRAGGSRRTGGNARLIARSHRRRRRAAPRLALGGGPATRRGAQPASDPASRAGSVPAAVKKGTPFLRRRLRRLAHTGPSRRAARSGRACAQAGAFSVSLAGCVENSPAGLAGVGPLGRLPSESLVGWAVPQGGTPAPPLPRGATSEVREGARRR